MRVSIEHADDNPDLISVNRKLLERVDYRLRRLELDLAVSGARGSKAPGSSKSVARPESDPPDQTHGEEPARRAFEQRMS